MFRWNQWQSNGYSGSKVYLDPIVQSFAPARCLLYLDQTCSRCNTKKRWSGRGRVTLRTNRGITCSKMQVVFLCFLQVFKPIQNLYIWWNLKAGKGKNWCLNMFDRYWKSITAIWTSCCARESWKISVKNLQGQSDRNHSKIINDWRTQRDVTS